MSNNECAPEVLKEVRLAEGDRIRVTTMTGTIYDIEVGEVETDLLQSRVIRKPIDKENPTVTEEIYEKVGIIGDYRVGMIVGGKSMDVIGLNADTGERVVLRTTPVETIAYIEEATGSQAVDSGVLPGITYTPAEAIGPDEWKIQRAISADPKSPGETIRAAGGIATQK
ncbi:MAG: hypothetical protein AAB896_02730 [Patescibacteria group bacterium]